MLNWSLFLDIELRNIIDKLAQFVARNGPDFEQMTKNKQKGNPKFQFLFGGEYYAYYQHKVNTEQSGRIQLFSNVAGIKSELFSPKAATGKWKPTERSQLEPDEAGPHLESFRRSQFGPDRAAAGGSARADQAERAEPQRTACCKVASDLNFVKFKFGVCRC